MQGITGGYKGLQEVTRSDSCRGLEWVEGVTMVYIRLLGSKGGYRVQAVTRGCKRLQRVTRSYKRLQGVTGGTKSYKGLQGITGGYRG